MKRAHIPIDRAAVTGPLADEAIPTEDVAAMRNFLGGFDGTSVPSSRISVWRISCPMSLKRDGVATLSALALALGIHPAIVPRIVQVVGMVLLCTPTPGQYCQCLRAAMARQGTSPSW